MFTDYKLNPVITKILESYGMQVPTPCTPIITIESQKLIDMLVTKCKGAHVHGGLTISDIKYMRANFHIDAYIDLDEEFFKISFHPILWHTGEVDHFKVTMSFSRF